MACHRFLLQPATQELSSPEFDVEILRDGKNVLRQMNVMFDARTPTHLFRRKGQSAASCDFAAMLCGRPCYCL